MPQQIHIYEEVKRQLHNDLRTQHPEWIKADGRCPQCGEHEARLKEVLETFDGGESKIEAPQGLLLQHQLTQRLP